ncbi:MAG: PTS sugar transporter subunit IIB [Lactobacillus sp.]|nr:PTS sugar transporter subunit IIB [Lactobacillus sp.]
MEEKIMNEKFILLACGSGASSGFMASSMRKEAKKRQLNLKIKAVSESEIEEYINDIDILLIGPHIEYLENELRETTQDKNVPLKIIPQKIYGRLDGKAALDLALENITD